MRNVVLILGATAILVALGSRCLFVQRDAQEEVADGSPALSQPVDPFPRAGKQKPVFSPQIKSPSRAPAMPQRGDKDGEELRLILSEAKRAFGYARLAQMKTGVIATGHVEGEPAASGPVRYSFTFGSKGRFVERMEGGLNALFGYDGTTTWALSWTRSPELRSLDADSAAQLAAWVRSGHWLNSPAPFDLSFDRPHSNAEQFALAIHGPGIKEALLYLDRSTWLPSQLLVKTPEGLHRWTFEDYAPVRGVQVARQVNHEGTGSGSRYDLTEVAVATASASELFEPLKFQAGRFTTTEPAANAPS